MSLHALRKLEAASKLLPSDEIAQSKDGPWFNLEDVQAKLFPATTPESVADDLISDTEDEPISPDFSEFEELGQSEYDQSPAYLTIADMARCTQCHAVCPPSASRCHKCQSTRIAPPGSAKPAASPSKPVSAPSPFDYQELADNAALAKAKEATLVASNRESTPEGNDRGLLVHALGFTLNLQQLIIVAGVACIALFALGSWALDGTRSGMITAVKRSLNDPTSFRLISIEYASYSTLEARNSSNVVEGFWEKEKVLEGLRKVAKVRFRARTDAGDSVLVDDYFFLGSGGKILLHTNTHTETGRNSMLAILAMVAFE